MKKLFFALLIFFLAQVPCLAESQDIKLDVKLNEGFLEALQSLQSNSENSASSAKIQDIHLDEMSLEALQSLQKDLTIEIEQRTNEIPSQISEKQNAIKDLLVSDDWIGLAVEDRIEFKADGSCSLYISSGEEVHNAKWALTDTHSLTISFTYLLPFIWKYEIIDKNGLIRLENAKEKQTFVLAEDFERAKKEIKPLMDELFVEVTNNEGEVEILSAKQLASINNKNSIKFQNKYFGAPATVISKIEEIKGSTIYNGNNMKAYVKLKGDWIVEISSPQKLADYEPGDIVKITGNIWDTWSDEVRVYIVNGHTTTIEPYTEQ